jgi:hypothetical protein
MKLTAKNVETVFRDCLLTEDLKDGEAVKVEGIMTLAHLHNDRLRRHQDDIAALLAGLPDEFREDNGGASFLNACVTRDGNQWGEHSNVEQLFILGIATGQVRETVPRSMWPVLPGGMPLFAVVTEQPKKPK